MQHDRFPAAAPAATARHYGLDWLRIAAFALLIVYHVCMVFAPWRWVIHTDHVYPALIAPMALLTPWRLPLLFTVSGFASRRLFERAGGAAGFARSRALRLLVPLAFGMAVLVPVEMWVRVMEAGYPHGYVRFWAVDYWRVGPFYGLVFPSWEHLWFLAYLGAYTLLLAGFLGWRGTKGTEAIDEALRRMCVGRKLVWMPAAGLIVLKLGLLFVVEEEQGLARDWSSHAHFVPLFLFGFAAGGVPRLWRALAANWRGALALAAATGVLIVWIETSYPGSAVPPHAVMALERAASVTMGWAMVVVLFHLAHRWGNHDHRWRKPLGEAVFPFYLIHQPAIVLIAWYTLPLGWSPVAEFAVLLAGTAAACLALYAMGRRIGWLRPLIGLRAVARDARSAREPTAVPGVF